MSYLRHEKMKGLEDKLVSMRLRVIAGVIKQVKGSDKSDFTFQGFFPEKVKYKGRLIGHLFLNYGYHPDLATNNIVITFEFMPV